MVNIYLHFNCEYLKSAVILPHRRILALIIGCQNLKVVIPLDWKRFIKQIEQSIDIWVKATWWKDDAGKSGETKTDIRGKTAVVYLLLQQNRKTEKMPDQLSHHRIRRNQLTAMWPAHMYTTWPSARYRESGIYALTYHFYAYISGLYTVESDYSGVSTNEELRCLGTYGL